jgi:N-acyl-D-amino-acid deacylase
VPAYDVVIRNGTVVDGSGAPGVPADVGIVGDRIATVGRIPVDEPGAVEIDAEGHVVTPGFIDGHTHLDAQVFWDPMATSSCWHGVTTVVMGNCGFTLAPARPDERHLVLHNLERAEDIPIEAMNAGLPWNWERFREYLDAIDGVPKGLNFSAYIGHSALRTWAMGERAFAEHASPDDLARMVAELEDALAAGAMGFSSSRSDTHVTTTGQPVASRVATWDELATLVAAVGRAGGVFALTNEPAMGSPDAEVRAEAIGRLSDLVADTGVTATFGVSAFGRPSRWPELQAMIDSTAARGGLMFGQTSGREQGALFSFRTWMPFDYLPVWQELRALPLEEQAAALRDPEVRRRLVDAVDEPRYYATPEKSMALDFERFFVLQTPVGANPSVAAVAAERGVSPVQLILDLAAETDLGQFFALVTGNDNLDQVQAQLGDPRMVMTFTDSGAHVGQVMNSSMHSHLFAFWVRSRGAFTVEEAVRMVTSVPAGIWGFSDRGAIREGFTADVNVFDPATVAPHMPEVVWDFPAGVRRLTQRSSGFLATLVAGQVVLDRGEDTGARPGRLLRRGR